MKGFGYNILADKPHGPPREAGPAYMSLGHAWWPYASAKQVERQQRQMAKRHTAMK